MDGQEIGTRELPRMKLYLALMAVFLLEAMVLPAVNAMAVPVVGHDLWLSDAAALKDGAGGRRSDSLNWLM